ncbi:MAG: hypothetical protein AAF990_08260 [Bacteroidota bacterium]
MKQEFTPEHLIKFIYKETSLAENVEINEALYNSNGLFESYESLMHCVGKLPKINLSPSARSIQNILSHSANTTVEPQH